MWGKMTRNRSKQRRPKSRLGYIEPSPDVQIASPLILKIGLRAFFTGDSDPGPLDPEKEAKFQQWLADRKAFLNRPTRPGKKTP